VPREYGGKPEEFITVTTDDYRAGKFASLSFLCLIAESVIDLAEF